MKKARNFILGFMFVLALAAHTVPAQSTTFTYQGVLNNNGAPANGNFDIMFLLFDASSGGTQLGPSFTHQSVPVTNGVFSVNLTFGSVFPGANRFLEIRVKPSAAAEFTPLAPRQPIHSVPYAMKSLNADTVGGLAPSNFVSTSAANINAGTSFSIDGVRVLSVGVPGNGNTFVGFGVAPFNTGTANSFFGNGAGAENTSGSSNSFFGSLAGSSNTTGGANSFFGAGSGQENVDGADNSFFGVNTGRANTTGSRNTFIGRLAGRFNTTGTDNTFVGFNAGLQNGNASFNTAFGSLAGENNTGANNAFFGGAAGQSNTIGSSNSFFGRQAGSANSTGDENSFFGRRAGQTNTTGIRNTLIGSDADLGAGNLINAAAIGARAFVTRSNSIILGSIFGVNGSIADTNVGIGNTAPINRLTIGQPETPLLNASLGIFNAGGVFMTARDTTSNIEGIFGADENGVIIGSMSNNSLIFRTGNTLRMSILSTGSVQVGPVGTNDGLLNVNGRIHVTTLPPGGNIDVCLDNGFLAGCGSSIRYKTDVEDFSGGLNLIRRLRPVSFKWKKDGRHDLGLVAEEVAAVEPLLTTTNDKGETEGVKYDRVGVVLVNAVNEQQTQIEAQQRQLDEQKEIIEKQAEKLTKQQTEIDALKRLVCAQNQAAEICRPKN